MKNGVYSSLVAPPSSRAEVRRACDARDREALRLL